MVQPPLLPTLSLTVSQLNMYLRELMDSDEVLRNVWVQGEISNLSRPTSGHIYFTLKDQNASLRCVIWRSTALRIRADLQNGLAIEAHGAVSVYERDGNYQLYVDTLRLGGEGRLLQEFLRLKARLESEGLFAIERKRPIPERPRRIGIVTSASGAALQDILNTLRRRYPLAEVILAPSAVQGEEAPAQLVAALRALNRLVQPDVILLARGGGSLEDLWAFNDERVVRAVAASQAPVISGVGHETDFTLADFAADLRAPTPTAAAVLATPDVAELRSALSGWIARLVNGLRQRLEDERDSLMVSRQRLERSSPLRRVQDERQRLDTLQATGQRILGHRLALERARLEGLRTRLVALNPAAVLGRGYALVAAADGQLVRSVDQVKPGESLQVQVSDGNFGAVVASNGPENG